MRLLVPVLVLLPIPSEVSRMGQCGWGLDSGFRGTFRLGEGNCGCMYAGLHTCPCFTCALGVGALASGRKPGVFGGSDRVWGTGAVVVRIPAPPSSHVIGVPASTLSFLSHCFAATLGADIRMWWHQISSHSG